MSGRAGLARAALLAAGAALAITAGAARAESTQPALAPAVAPPMAPVPWSKQAILALAERVADHEIAALAQRTPLSRPSFGDFDTRSWIQGVFLTGMTELADASADGKYRAFVLGQLEAAHYTLDRTGYEANDQIIAQSYAWAWRHGVGDRAIRPTIARFDDILANPPRSSLIWPSDPRKESYQTGARYSWIDAYFMSPSAWLDVSAITHDPRYAAYALSELWASHAVLWDAGESLYFRDARFIAQRDAKGQKIFWSRGNAWVLAGFADMLRRLPEASPDRPKLVAIFQAMALRLRSLQKPNGTWSPSLLDDSTAAPPESSGTALYTYALAWGIKAGILDRATFAPVVRRGWAALVRNVHPDGKLGFVQQVGDAPDNVGYDDTQFYGSGGFLLAAVAVAELGLTPASG